MVNGRGLVGKREVAHKLSSKIFAPKRAVGNTMSLKVEKDAVVALIGEESLLTLCAEKLIQQGWRVQYVVTGSDAIRTWCEDQQIACLDSATDLLSQDPIDVLFSITNFKIIPSQVLQHSRLAINFHDGPLPEMGGLNVPTWSLLNGHRTHGITWHRISEEVDAGEILLKRVFDIQPGTSLLELNAECFNSGLNSFSELLASLEEGTLEAKPGQRPKQFFERTKTISII